VASKLKAGVVWINSTNMFDAAGRLRRLQGKRLRPRGRPRGHAGISRAGLAEKGKAAAGKRRGAPLAGARAATAVDRTVKMYIGGKQARPDSGYSYPVTGERPHRAEVGLGNRKDIRNAVEAAHKASGWSGMTGHNRAQVLYFLAENLAAARRRIRCPAAAAGASKVRRETEVEASVRRCFMVRGLGRQVSTARCARPARRCCRWRSTSRGT
jgi:aldehyde dehydrogenase (NAD+)